MYYNFQHIGPTHVLLDLYLSIPVFFEIIVNGVVLLILASICLLLVCGNAIDFVC